MTARSRIAVPCAQCGAIVEATPSRLARGPRQFCSPKCHDTFRAGKINPHLRAGETRSCPMCGGPFYIYPGALNHPRWGRFCSNACYRRSTAVHNDVNCAHCGAQFERRELEMKGKRRSFCNAACQTAFQQSNPKAAPRYAGGRYPWYGPDWNHQKRAARERDGHTCQDCGSHQRRPLLDVHHLIPRRVFGEDFKTANHLDNLIALCKPCHSVQERTLDESYRSEPLDTSGYVRKDRYLRGSANPKAKLTEGQVAAIKHLLQQRQSKASIARQFRISEPTIFAIATERMWKHVLPLEQPRLL